MSVAPFTQGSRSLQRVAKRAVRPSAAVEFAGNVYVTRHNIARSGKKATPPALARESASFVSPREAAVAATGVGAILGSRL